jgi:hypothetical protein
MERVLVNGVEESTFGACNHWGELLEHLDQSAAGDGKVLTAVRFDGVDQPSFRDPVEASKRLDTLLVVEAEAVAPGALLDISIGEAVAAARGLAAGAERVGAGFRGFDVSRASQDLQELAQGIGTLVAVSQAIAQAVGLPLEGVGQPGRTGADLVASLSSQTDELIKARESGDWITVADIVEYDLAPLLHEWPAVLGAFRCPVSN